MALISCPECGKEISDQAAACPNCGYNLYEEDGNDEDNSAAIPVIALICSFIAFFTLGRFFSLGIVFWIIGNLFSVISLIKGGNSMTTIAFIISVLTIAIQFL